MGFKDGTNNIKAQNQSDLDSFVWVGTETDQPWMRGGCDLVARRIRMLIESWDTDYLADQERVFGRFKVGGAPLTGPAGGGTASTVAASGGVTGVAGGPAASTPGAAGSPPAPPPSCPGRRPD